MPTLTKFLDKKPTLVGRVDGISFYEGPFGYGIFW